MRGQIDALLGCDWGHVIATADYQQPCHARATRIVVLHNGGAQADVRLCDPHVEFVLLETNPHAGEVPA